MPEPKYIRLSKAPSEIERLTGLAVTAATVHRWRKLGLAGVFLKTVFIGGSQATTSLWLCDFFTAVNQAKQKGLAGPDGPPATS